MPFCISRYNLIFFYHPLLRYGKCTLLSEDCSGVFFRSRTSLRNVVEPPPVRTCPFSRTPSARPPRLRVANLPSPSDWDTSLYDAAFPHAFNINVVPHPAFSASRLASSSFLTYRTHEFERSLVMSLTRSVAATRQSQSAIGVNVDVEAVKQSPLYTSANS